MACPPDADFAMRVRLTSLALVECSSLTNMPKLERVCSRGAPFSHRKQEEATKVSSWARTLPYLD